MQPQQLRCRPSAPRRHRRRCLQAPPLPAALTPSSLASSTGWTFATTARRRRQQGSLWTSRSAARRRATSSPGAGRCVRGRGGARRLYDHPGTAWHLAMQVEQLANPSCHLHLPLAALHSGCWASQTSSSKVTAALWRCTRAWPRRSSAPTPSRACCSSCAPRCGWRRVPADPALHASWACPAARRGRCCLTLRHAPTVPQGHVEGWRNELYPAIQAFHDEPAFLIERAAAPHFGIKAYGAPGQL